jgi:hypothetical protein
LDLSQNQFRSIGLLQLPKLKKLILSQNQIGFVSPTAFTQTLELTELNLTENKIKTFKPETFSSLGKLEILKLEQNRLTAVTPDLFAGLTGLKQLVLADNPLESVEGIGAFVALEKLDLKQTALEAIKQLRPLVDLKALKNVSFDGAPVSSVDAFRSDVILLLPWLETIDEEAISFGDRQDAIALDEERKAEAERLRKEAEAEEKDSDGDKEASDAEEKERSDYESKSEDATESYATYESDDK